MCMSRNGVPKCGTLAGGIWVSVCQNGVGAVRGTTSGQAVAEMAAGEDSGMAAFEDLHRFPPSFVTMPVMQARILAVVQERLPVRRFNTFS